MPISIIDVRKDTYRLFTSIAIETSSSCNRRCPFCPVSHYPRPANEYMQIDIFEKIIRELSELKYSGRVEFYMYNEPMIATDLLVTLIKVARLLLPRACFMINTNGDYIHGPADIKRLIDAGLNQIGINIYSNEKRYNSMLDIASEFNSEGSLYQNIGRKKVVVKVVPKFGITVDNIKLGGVDHISNRAGNIPKFLSASSGPIDKVCTRPFRFLNINWCGDAMLCCNDYKVDVSIGNVREFSVVELWNSLEFNLYRLKLQSKDRYLPVCDRCDFSGGYYPHMLHNVTFGDFIDNQAIELDISYMEDFREYIDSILSIESTRWC